MISRVILLFQICNIRNNFVCNVSSQACICLSCFLIAIDIRSLADVHNLIGNVVYATI